MSILDNYDRPGGAAVDRFEAAKERAPKFPHGIHVVTDESGKPVEVWLNTEASDFDGLCIGTGENCLADAVRTLEQAIDILQSPPSPEVYRPAKDWDEED